MQQVEETVIAYQFRGKGKGKETMVEMPKQTWENFSMRRKDGSYIFKGAENFRLLSKGESTPKIEDDGQGEVTLTEKDLKNLGAKPQTETQKKFNELLSSAEKLFIEGKSFEALEFYKEAKKLLPDENYPKERIKQINIQLQTKKD